MHSIDARQSNPCRILIGVFACASLLVCFSACGKQDRIQSYVVERPKTEILAAVTRRGKSVWFFKVMAPKAALEEVRTQIDDFFRTIRWPPKEALEPTWTLPKDWKKEPASGLREATLTFHNRGLKFEVTVLHLPMKDDDWNSYLLDNVNRWRKQLLLNAWTQAELVKDLKTVESGDDEILFFDLVGYVRPERQVITQADVDRMNPQAQPQISRPRTRPSTPKWETPEAWEKLPATGIRVAAFRIREGDKKAEVTLIPLAPSSILDNVNRWRGQINLTHWTQKDLDDNLQKIPVGSLEALYVELFELDGKEKPQCILGGILLHGGQAWFFKLKGDKAVGMKQRDNFKKFIGSIRF